MLDPFAAISPASFGVVRVGRSDALLAPQIMDIARHDLRFSISDGSRDERPQATHDQHGPLGLSAQKVQCGSCYGRRPIHPSHRPCRGLRVDPCLPQASRRRYQDSFRGCGTWVLFELCVLSACHAARLASLQKALRNRSVCRDSVRGFRPSHERTVGERGLRNGLLVRRIERTARAQLLIPSPQAERAPVCPILNAREPLHPVRADPFLRGTIQTRNNTPTKRIPHREPRRNIAIKCQHNV